ncbi:MAG: hypothetical protein P1U70_06150 [Saprospiraceae bacterium]|jgi:hypothetical protein|nr:hypothetical protein [Saprospiraceae bacterium]
MDKKPFVFKEDSNHEPSKKELEKDDLFFEYKDIDGNQNMKDDFEITGDFISDKTSKEQLFAFMRLEREYIDEKKTINKLNREQKVIFNEGVKKGIHLPKHIDVLERQHKLQLKLLKNDKQKFAKSMFKNFLKTDTKSEFNKKASKKKDIDMDMK